MIKAIIFDMDGVLVDAKDWHYHALNKALEKFNQFISVEDHLNIFDGLPTNVKLDILSQSNGLDTESHQFINELKQKYTLELFSNYVVKNNVLIDLLQNLQRSYKLSLCSNSREQTIAVFLNKSETKEFFEFDLSNQDVKYPKPNPEIYQKAINMLGVGCDECLVLEDNVNGIKAAKASGAHVLEIKDISEVNLKNIVKTINKINLASS